MKNVAVQTYLAENGYTFLYEKIRSCWFDESIRSLGALSVNLGTFCPEASSSLPPFLVTMPMHVPTHMPRHD